MLHPVGPRQVRRARSPTGCGTSASPSSTPPCRRPGLATGGLHPVVAVYATFLNRAFDQLLMDVALHSCGVTFVLDRAGVTGVDGAVPQRHVGHVHPPGRARPADRRAARRRPAARPAARGGRRRRRAHPDPLPQGVGRRPRIPAVGRVGGHATCCTASDGGRRRAAGRGRRDGAGPACGPPNCWRRAASAARSSTRAGSSPSTRRCRDWPPGTAWWPSSRTTAARRASAPRSRRRCGDAEVDVPVRDFGIPRAVPRARQARRVLADIGLTPVEIAGRIGAGARPPQRRAVPSGRLRRLRPAGTATGGSARRGLGEARMTTADTRCPVGGRSTSARCSPSAAPSATSCTARYLNHQLPAHAAHHRLRQGLRAGRGRVLLGRRRQRLPRHARRLRRDGPRPPPPRGPQGAARRPGRRARRPHPLRLPAAARAARREAAHAQPRTWTGCSSATAAPRRSRPR